MDKTWIKNQTQFPVNGLEQDSIPNAGFVNYSRLRVVYFENNIRVIAPIPLRQLAAQFKNVILKIKLKISNIFFASFSFPKFPPRG